MARRRPSLPPRLSARRGPPASGLRGAGGVMAFETEVTERDEVAVLADRLRDAQPLEVLRAAYEHYGDRLALVSSFGAESAVLLHMVSQVDKSIPVLFLDTGMLF